MRVLMVHNEYQQQGGEDESTRVETALLRERGIDVETYQVSNHRISELGGVHVALRAIWSREDYCKIREILRKNPCAIVHVQNFFPLISPSVYYAAIQGNARVVQTLRNYRLLCPNAIFYRDGRPCEDCRTKFVPWPGVLHRCYRSDTLATAAVAAMLTGHRLIQTWSRRVDAYIALTEFAKQKFVDGGLPAEKITVKPNFVFSQEFSVRRKPEASYFLNVGRLSPEKGVPCLVNAWHAINVDAPLKVVGTGPLLGQLREAHNRPRIQFLGQLDRIDIAQLMAGAYCLIFPSQVYEGMPRTIIEAFACGVPVIGSKLGSTAEIIREGVTGLHFEPGNAVDLATKVEWAWSHPKEMEEMGRAARREYEAKYTPELNYKLLMDIYERVIGNGHGTLETRTTAVVGKDA